MSDLSSNSPSKDRHSLENVERLQLSLSSSRTRTKSLWFSRTSLVRLICVSVLLLATSEIGLAHGGAVQFRATAPPFVVMVFTDPPQCRAGQLDLSASVQQENSPILDAEVTVSLFPLEPAQASPTAAWLPPACVTSAPVNLQNIPLRIADGANRLFYSALIQIPYDGRWQLQMSVRRGGNHAVIQGILDVDRPLPPFTAYWQWFLFPFFAIGGFVLHQHIRASRIAEGRKA
jgi:hypothetical protein